MKTESRPYLDFKSIKERASIVAVLDRYHVQLRRVNTSQFSATCPLPSHTNKTEKSSFGVNVEKGVFKCHSDSCRKASNGKNQGNILDFVALMENCSAYDAAAKLDEWFPDNQKPARTQSAGAGGTTLTDMGEPSNSTPPAPEVNRPLAFTLKDISARHEMIQSRGISEETAKKYGVGFFPGKGSMAGRVVFPLYENSTLIGYAGRIVDCGEGNLRQEPKWKLPAGLHKSFVYGLEHCDPKYPLILGESFWLPLFMAEKGAQAASLMGSELTAAQEAALAPFKIIWLAFDNDEAGIEKSRPIAERLRKSHAVRISKLRE